MKIKIGPYIGHYSLYNTLNMLRYRDWLTEEQGEYWYDKLKDNRVVTAIYSFLNSLLPKERDIRIKLDKYDTWGMDNTLAHIIHPMLVQLKEVQHGAPNVDNDDVPEELHRIDGKEDWADTDDNHFKRWDHVLDEMIWTFNEIKLGRDASDMIVYPEGYFDNWIEESFVKIEGHDMYEMVSRPIDDQVIRPEAEMKAYNERRKNGLRLFGKYYHSLWD